MNQNGNKIAIFIEDLDKKKRVKLTHKLQAKVHLIFYQSLERKPEVEEEFKAKSRPISLSNQVAADF